MGGTTATGSTTTVITMFSTVGVAEAGVVAVICLIILLSASEILSASKLWNGRLSASFNLTIWPLVITFFAIVFFRVMEILR